MQLDKNGQTTRYTYDPLGRRTTKQDEFGTTHYHWAGDQLTQETRGQHTKTYIYELDSFKPVALVQDKAIYHYHLDHLDHLGTPKHLSNSAGNIVWQARYQTYGNAAVKQEDGIENNLRFQGQYFDEESGLHYNRHRYYDPRLGQFTQQDPIGLLGGVNNYQYVPNPISWIDPFGLSCKEGISTPAGESAKPILALPAPDDPLAQVNSQKVSVIVDEESFLKFFVAKDPMGNPVFDRQGNYAVANNAILPAGKYVTFKEDIAGMNIVEARRATATYSVPGRKDYRAYEEQNYRVDIDFSGDMDAFSVPELSPEYLNDIGGPRALGGARQRTLNRQVKIGGKVENVTRYEPQIKPTPE